MNKFNVGDIVTINDTSERGCITKVNASLGDVETIYEVRVGDAVRLYREVYLDLFMNKEEDSLKDKIISMDISKFSEIFNNDVFDKIIGKLDLHRSDNILSVLSNVCKVVKYLVEKSVDIKVDIDFVNQSDFNAYLLSSILKRLNIESLNVKLKTDGYDYYVANLVLLGDLYYYFDVTAEKDLYMKTKDFSQLLLCSQGIGKKNYEKFFLPLGVIDLKTKNIVSSLPSNIADDDLDMDLINKVVGISVV